MSTQFTMLMRKLVVRSLQIVTRLGVSNTFSESRISGCRKSRQLPTMVLACNTCVFGLASQYAISLRRKIFQSKAKGIPLMRQGIPLVNQVSSSANQFISLANQPISLRMNGQTTTCSVPVYIEHDFRDQIITQSHQSH
ncbi:hypothetical protein WL89_21375 [Burkholderia cenocepacia]|nr:hypothetical protein WL89_21375 [Burkholderia cenocepacia]